MPRALHSKVKSCGDSKLCKIMDMMKVRMQFYDDLKNHTYFFTDPTYESQNSKTFLRKIKQSPENNKTILTDLAEIL